ncbi:unnamed protein product, partial [Effrenium voratum]
TAPSALLQRGSRMDLLGRVLKELPRWNLFYLAVDAVLARPLPGWRFQEDLVAIFGSDAFGHRRALAALWLRPVPEVSELLEEVAAAMAKAPLLGAGSLFEESLTLFARAQAKPSFRLAEQYAGDVVSYAMRFSSMVAQVHAMRGAGHWCGSDGNVAGVWDLVFSNGFRTSYDISETEVVAASADGPGRGQLQVLEAGKFSHKLVGIHRLGTWERFRLDRPGRMYLEHWQQDQLLAIARGVRRVAARRGCYCSPPDVPERSALQAPVRGLRRRWRVKYLLPSPAPTQQVQLGFGGGFGSKLQIAVARAAKILRSGRRAELVGHLGRYTNNSHCPARFRRGGWSCLFEEVPLFARPERRQLVSAGKLQAALWQPSRWMWGLFQQFARGSGFRAEATLLAIHIRRGDKVTNPFNKYHPATDYVAEALGAAEQLGLCEAKCQLFVASDSKEVLDEVRAEKLHSERLEVIGLEDSETQRRSDIGVEVANFMPGDGTALQMTAEVMFDIEMLGRARVVVGTLASQVTRVACSIGTARGTLLRAVALDFHLLQGQQELHRQWGVRVNDVRWQPPARLAAKKRSLSWPWAPFILACLSPGPRQKAQGDTSALWLPLLKAWEDACPLSNHAQQVLSAEDAHVIDELRRDVFEDALLFAVLDGHGGEEGVTWGALGSEVSALASKLLTREVETLAQDGVCRRGEKTGSQADLLAEAELGDWDANCLTIWRRLSSCRGTGGVDVDRQVLRQALPRLDTRLRSGSWGPALNVSSLGWLFPGLLHPFATCGSTCVACAVDLIHREAPASSFRECWRRTLAVALSEDHKPENPVERNRIRAAGGQAYQSKDGAVE